MTAPKTYPEFVTLNGIALRHYMGGEYGRVAGDWSIQSHFVEGVHCVNAPSGKMSHANGCPLVPCSKAFWREDNAGYCPP